MKSFSIAKPIFFLTFFVILSSFFVPPLFVSAEQGGTAQTYGDSFGSGASSQTGGAGSGSQTGGAGSSGGVAIQNPLNGINSISEFVQKLLQAVVAIGVPIAVLFIVLAGFKFITARGNPEELAKARTNFVHVVIGVAIFIGAWAIAQLIVATLRQIGANV